MTIAPDAPMPWIFAPGAALPPAPPLWALWGAACALDTGSPLAGVYAGECQPEPVLGVAWVAVMREGREVRVSGGPYLAALTPERDGGTTCGKFACSAEHEPTVAATRLVVTPRV